MVFPLNIKRNINLSHPFKNNQKEIALSIITEEFKKLKVDKFEKDEQIILFTNKFWNGQGGNHIFASIDGGKIKCNENNIQITFSTKRMAITTFIMASLLGLISRSTVIGFIAFSWLYGMNIIIFFIRSSTLINRFKKEIEK